MGIVHQEGGFTFTIEASYQEPPYVYVTKGKGFIVIQIGDPETGDPHVDEYKRVSREDVDAAYHIVWTYQEKFMGAWERNHNFATRNMAVTEKGKKRMVEIRLALKSGIKEGRIRKALGEICDKRFGPLQKRVIEDLEQAKFKTVRLNYYFRLGGWSHTGGSYLNTMIRIRELCKIIFGYEIPAKIEKFNLKDYRYRVINSDQSVAKAILEFHKKRISKG